MNKYLKLTIFFIGLGVFLLFAGLPLYSYLVLNALKPSLYFSLLPFINMSAWDMPFYLLYYGAFVLFGLAVPSGIVASRQTILAKSKWASIALILTIADVLYLLGVIIT